MNVRIEQLFGQWTSENWRITLSESGSLLIEWPNGNKASGEFILYEDFLILKCETAGWKSWTGRMQSYSENLFRITDLSEEVGRVEEMKRTYFHKSLIPEIQLPELFTIQDVKEEFGIQRIGFNNLYDQEGNFTGYLRYWNNALRCSVLITNDLADSLDEDADLYLEASIKVKCGKLGYYTNIFLTELPDAGIEKEHDYEDHEYRSYDQYNGVYGLDDFTINSAFDGDPDNYWNID